MNSARFVWRVCCPWTRNASRNSSGTRSGTTRSSVWPTRPASPQLHGLARIKRPVDALDKHPPDRNTVFFSRKVTGTGQKEAKLSRHSSLSVTVTEVHGWTTSFGYRSMRNSLLREDRLAIEVNAQPVRFRNQWPGCAPPWRTIKGWRSRPLNALETIAQLSPDLFITFAQRGRLTSLSGPAVNLELFAVLTPLVKHDHCDTELASIRCAVAD